MSFFRLAFSLLLLSGCASSADRGLQNSWYLGVGRPYYMEAWVESIQFKDVNGDVSLNAGFGVPSGSSPASLKADPSGWGWMAGVGKGKYMQGYALPQQIYVRWQSLVEQKTYEATLHIADATRRSMDEIVNINCSYAFAQPKRNELGLALAPGGVVRVVQGGPCMEIKEVMKVQGRLVSDQGTVSYVSLSPAAKAYIEKYGIPYESWR